MPRSSTPKRLIPSSEDRTVRPVCVVRRRNVARYSSGLLLAVVSTGLALNPARATQPTPQWGIFELALKAGPMLEALNPYTDINFSAWFFQDGPAKEVVGFYDGNGTFRVRFMPSQPGTWHYTSISSLASLEGHSGEFVVTTPSVKSPTAKSPTAINGPVGIAPGPRFAYPDGTIYEPHGTTATVAMFEKEARRQKTLKMLKEGAFNKVRLAVLPATSESVHLEPPIYPFEGTPHHFKPKRFNPVYFQRLERAIAELQRRGIEADVILFHAEDNDPWGFDERWAEDQELYVRYVIARLGAFHNVWWSLANEFDRLKIPGVGDFERLGKRIVASDPYHHLLSIHSGGQLFDYKRPWITHVSLSAEAAAAGAAHAAVTSQSYGKPVAIDASH